MFGLGLRSRKTTRHIPIVFVDGEPVKVSRVKTVLPDAVFTEWPKIGTAVKAAIKNRPANPLVPNIMAGYSGTPLPKKLGIKPGIVVALVNARMPSSAGSIRCPTAFSLRKTCEARPTWLFCYASRMADIYEQFPRAERSLNEGGKLWIAWPKQASGVKTDVTQPAVREFGLAAAWVDFKICAIDKTWSGLAFARRNAKANRTAR